MQYSPVSAPSGPYPGNYPAVPGYKACMDPCACKLKVEGKGTVRAQPDTAVVILGVYTENKLLRPAQEENARKISDVINTLNRLGVSSKDIQTQSYTIEPQYDYVEGKQVFRNYRVTHTLSVTIRDVNRVGEIIDAAVASGANIVNSISFSVSDPSRYYQQALRAAIDDAQAKAVTIGNKLRINVSQTPVSITEEIYQPPIPYQTALMQAPEAATPIQPGQVEITARIEAVFAYGQQ